MAQLVGVDSSVVDKISTAIRSGEATSLNQYYASAVDVTILNFQDFLDKSSASKKVNDFFNGKKVMGYKVNHEGKSKGKDSVYTIGTLSTDQGDFQMYMFISSKAGKYFIEEIKIEK